MNKKTACLRKVNIEDARTLYDWRNDGDVRKNSFTEDFIEFDVHVKWLENALKKQNVLFYIMVIKEVDIGQIRINMEDGVGLISYSIDKRFRGRGYGKMILNLLEEKIVANNFVIHKLEGLVKYGNIASQKVFESLGYVKEEADCIKYIKDLS